MNLTVYRYDDDADTALVSYEAMYYLKTTEIPPPLIFVGLQVIADMHCNREVVYLVSKTRMHMESIYAAQYLIGNVRRTL